MSLVTKLILSVLLQRIRRSVTPEISDVQCGFVKDKGTRNATFILRQLAERSIEHQQDMYLCFLDYSKAFDRVRHEPLLEILQSLDIDGKDLRILRNLYWDQTAAVRIDDELSGWAKIQRGVRQGCVISPDLFSLYSESILRHLDSCTGITVGGRQLSNLRYADDTVLLATSKEDLQKLLEIVINESEKLGLNLNAKKTFSMVISGKEVIPTCDLTIGAASVTQVDKFSYLGSWITSTGRSWCDIRSRIAQSKQAFIKLDSVLSSNTITLKTRQRILKAYVWSVLLYGCESWTICPKMEKRINSAEIWFVRKMLGVIWKDRVSNEEIWTRSGCTKGLLMETIMERQMTFLGHIYRQRGIEHLVLTGRIPGSKKQVAQDAL